MLINLHNRNSHDLQPVKMNYRFIIMVYFSLFFYFATAQWPLMLNQTQQQPLMRSTFFVILRCGFVQHGKKIWSAESSLLKVNIFVIHAHSLIWTSLGIFKEIESIQKKNNYKFHEVIEKKHCDQQQQSSNLLNREHKIIIKWQIFFFFSLERWSHAATPEKERNESRTNF